MSDDHVRASFASLTCLFEDMHAVAVEGQQSGLPVDLARLLIGNVRERLLMVERLLVSMEAGLP